MYNVYLFPSFYAHVITGVLLFIALFLLCKNHTTISKLEPYKLIMLVLVFSITIGIHGLSHLGLEKNYNYNPLEL
jgi:tetrahydromethanopterin S-methyltransferase subunit E